MKKYIIGNWLRGYFEGDFETIEKAWSYLSNRFLLSYPSNGGRHVCMWVEQDNDFGFKQTVLCKQDVTEINQLAEGDVLSICKQSPYIIK